jgi:hypothetical protein
VTRYRLDIGVVLSAADLHLSAPASALSSIPTNARPAIARRPTAVAEVPQWAALFPAIRTLPIAEIGNAWNRYRSIGRAFYPGAPRRWRIL